MMKQNRADNKTYKNQACDKNKICRTPKLALGLKILRMKTTTELIDHNMKIMHSMKYLTNTIISKIRGNVTKNNSDKLDLLRVLNKIEELDKTWVRPVPEGYQIWTPSNEIRLWCVPKNTGALLESLATVTKAKTILELGTSAGYSTLRLAWGAKLNNGRVYTIELDNTKIEMARDHFTEAKMSDYVVQIHDNIDDEILRWNKPVDFIFFDAEKTKYITYLKHLLPYLNPKGIIVADNAINYANKMNDFLEFVNTNKDLESFLYNIDNGLLLISKKQSSAKNYLQSIVNVANELNDI